MQKTGKWRAFIMAAFTVFLFGGCSDWGQMDPPAGNQVFPKLQKMATFNFNDEIDEAFQLLAYTGGNLPALKSDEELGSVIHLNGGYLKISNPLNDVKVQNGVSLTFWVKQAAQDLKGAIFSFENGNHRMFFTANGWLSYNGPDGSYDYNNPASVTTGIMTAGEWHYVAMSVTNTGYFVYVDGEQMINHSETGFDCSKIVQFMASAPLFNIGYGSTAEPAEMWIDDVSIFRNQIAEAQIKVPEVTGSGPVKEYIIVGNEDRSTPWWSAFSDLVTMQGDQTMKIGFYNHTNGANNWNNYAIVLTNGRKFGDAGYAEYFVLRADAYGWGSGHVGGNITHNYNWSTFKSDMDGAWVEITIKRTDNRIDLTAVTTTKDNIVYTMNYFYTGDLAATIGAFLTCEGSYLEIDPETVFVGQTYTPGSYLVGPADLSAGWWRFFSDLTVITGNTPSPLVYSFINRTNGAANWNNWLIVCTNGKNRGEDGYAENFVLRADAYGWGSSYVGANISHSYNWPTYPQQMNGADCKVSVSRIGDRIEMVAKVTTASGEQLGDYTFFCTGISTPEIGFFLTVEGASLNINSVGYYPLLK